MMTYFGVLTLEWCEKANIACSLPEFRERVMGEGVCEGRTKRREELGP